MKTTIEIDEGIIPEGWELVRIGKAEAGENFVEWNETGASRIVESNSDKRWRVIVRPKPQPLSIEAGKRYVTRGGHVVGPMFFDTEYGPIYPWRVEVYECTWSSGGTVWVSDESVNDFISEYIEPKPQARPFRNGTEFAPHAGRLFHCDCDCSTVGSFGERTVSFLWGCAVRQETYAWMLEHCTWVDGSPFGVLE